MTNTLKHANLQIASRDGYPLSALLIEPNAQTKGVIQINAGTGIKKEFYKNFAEFLSEQGYAVLLFDYRGIGGSRPKSLKGFKAKNHEWGTNDMAAVLDWLDDRFPDLPKYVIGHSAGGQQLGLMDNHHKITKAFLVGCSTGYWHNLTPPYKYFTAFIWYVFIPLTTGIVGYAPASWFKLGEDLPKHVALEWRSWCLNKSYFRDFLGKTIPQHFYHEVKIPMHFLYAEDDSIANDKTVPALAGFYSDAKLSFEKITLKEYNMKEVGHFGFFSRKAKDKLWTKAVEFFEDDKTH